MIYEKIPVVIDCDPGIDDAVALALAFARPELEILAVTTVAGNVDVEKTTANACTLLAAFGTQCKVHKGAAQALLHAGQVSAADVHGHEGLGNFVPKSRPIANFSEESALSAQRRILEEREGPVTFVALGPLTNLALLLRAYPHLAAKIGAIYLMGGGIFGGNHSAAAEFNILADPEAADIVYGSGVPIVMAGLDVTNKAVMTQTDLEALRAVGTPVAHMLCSALEFYFDSPYQDPERRICQLHDAVAVLALVNPDLVSGEHYQVAVETGGRFCRGFTLADRRPIAARGKKNCYVLLDIDARALNAEVLKAVKSYSRM